MLYNANGTLAGCTRTRPRKKGWWRKRGIPAVSRRYITRLSAAASMFYQLSAPVVIGAGEDFELELPFVNSFSGVQMLLGTDSTWSCIFIDPGNKSVSVRDIAGTTKATSGSSYSDGLVCLLSIKRVSNVLTIKTPNGTWTDSTVTGGFEFKYAGKRKEVGEYFFTGEVYDLKIWKNGDRNTGTLVLDMPIDEDWTRGTVVHNRAAQLGGNLIVNGDFSDGLNSWVDESGDGSTIVTDSKLTLHYNTLQQIASQSMPTNIGSKYLLEFDVTELESTYGFQVGTVIKVGQALTGRVSVIFEAKDAISKLQLKKGGVQSTSVTFDNISIREIPSGYPLATGVNVTENEAEKFTKVDGGANWLGEELFANKAWSTTDTGVWSLDNSLNFAASNGTGASTTYAYKNSISQVGVGLRCEFVVTDFSGSAGFLSLSNGGSSLQFSSSGKYFLDGVKTSNESVYFGALSGAGFGVTGSSVKRLIPIA